MQQHTQVDVFSGATSAWLYILTSIMGNGRETSPRGMRTKEVLHNAVAFDMNYPVVWSKERRLNYSFMAAEALWILNGSNSCTDIVPYNKQLGQFSDNGRIFNGAYGPHYVKQLEYVVNSLINDRDTRQAVMTFWDRNPPKSKDIPCTVSLTFNIRDQKLNCHVFMRSSDAWLGIPYDFFSFTMMALKVACQYNQWHLLNVRDSEEVGRWLVEPGLLFWTGVSSHLYEKNWGAVGLCLQEEDYRECRPVHTNMIEKGNYEYLEKSLLICRDKQESDYNLSQHAYWRIRP